MRMFTPPRKELLILILSLFIFNLDAQTLVETTGLIGSNKKVYPNVTYQFQIHNIPAGSSIIDVYWTGSFEVDFIVNNISQGSSYSLGSLTNITVKFNDTYIFMKQEVKFKIFLDNDGNGTSDIEIEDDIKDLSLKAIPNTINLAGKTDVQECCLEDLLYQVKSTGSSDLFQWYRPQGWTPVTTSNGGKNFTVEPSNSTSGNIQVVASIAGHPVPGAYSKTATLQSTRSRPQFTTFSIPVSGCAFELVEITYAKICGATGYELQLPSNYQIVNQMLPSGDLNGSFIFQNNGEPGPIILTAHFDGCESVSVERNFNIIGSAPQETPVFQPLNYTYFHYAQWFVCPEGASRIELASPTTYLSEKVEWEIIGPYHFTMNGAKTFLSNGLNDGLTVWVAADQSALPNPGTATIRARFANCHAPAVAWTTETLYQESSEWCEPNHTYPVWCDCPGSELCDTTGWPFPKSALIEKETPDEYRYYPNPTTSHLTIERPIESAARFVIHSVSDGKSVMSGQIEGHTSTLDIAELVNGIYTLQIFEITGATQHYRLIKISAK